MSLSNFVFENPDFKEMYEFWQPKEEIIQRIKDISIKTYLVHVFASNICQYCKIHIPHLLKIYDQIKFNFELVVWEDYTDDETIELMDKFSLTGLPSIIIYRLEPVKKEVGRITKEPDSSLEQDLLEILLRI